MLYFTKICIGLALFSQVSLKGEVAPEDTGVTISVAPSRGPKTVFQWENPLSELLTFGNFPPACKSCHLNHAEVFQSNALADAFFTEMMQNPVTIPKKRQLASPAPTVEIPKPGTSCAICVWADDNSAWQGCETAERRKNRTACEDGWENTANPKRCVWKATGNRCIAESKDQCYQYASSVAGLYPEKMMRIFSKSQFLNAAVTRVVFDRLREVGCNGQVTAAFMEDTNSPENLLRYLGVVATQMPENPRIFVDAFGCGIHRDLAATLNLYKKAPHPVIAKSMVGRAAVISANQLHAVGAPGRFDLVSASQTRAVFEIKGTGPEGWSTELTNTSWCRDQLNAEDMPRWCTFAALNQTMKCRTGIKNQKEVRSQNTCCHRPSDGFSAQLPDSLRYVFLKGSSCN